MVHSETTVVLNIEWKPRVGQPIESQFSVNDKLAETIYKKPRRRTTQYQKLVAFNQGFKRTPITSYIN